MALTLKEYNKNHAACPRCNSTKFSQSYVGYIFNGENYKNENYYNCACGSTGIVHNLVPEKSNTTQR